MKYHTTKEGEEILISDMDDKHLMNTIRMKDKHLKVGITQVIGSCDYDEEKWGEEITYYGEGAKRILNYDSYTNEAIKRGLIKGEKE